MRIGAHAIARLREPRHYRGITRSSSPASRWPWPCWLGRCSSARRFARACATSRSPVSAPPMSSSSSTSFFRDALADDVRSPRDRGGRADARLTGAVVHEDSRRAASKVNVFGIDDRFLAFHGRLRAHRAARSVDQPGAGGGARRAAGDELVHARRQADRHPARAICRADGTMPASACALTVRARRRIARTSASSRCCPRRAPALRCSCALSRLQQDLDLDRRANALLVRMAPPLTATSSRTCERRSAPRCSSRTSGCGCGAIAADTTLILESRTGLLPEARLAAPPSGPVDRGGRRSAS